MLPLDSYDNDFLFYLDDDIFWQWADNLIPIEELLKYNRMRIKAKEMEKEDGV